VIDRQCNNERTLDRMFRKASEINTDEHYWQFVRAVRVYVLFLLLERGDVDETQ